MFRRSLVHAGTRSASDVREPQHLFDLARVEYVPAILAASHRRAAQVQRTLAAAAAAGKQKPCVTKLFKKSRSKKAERERARDNFDLGEKAPRVRVNTWSVLIGIPVKPTFVHAFSFYVYASTYPPLFPDGQISAYRADPSN